MDQLLGRDLGVRRLRVARVVLLPVGALLVGGCTARSVPDDLSFDASGGSFGSADGRPSPDEGRPEPFPEPDPDEDYPYPIDEGLDDSFDDGFDDGWKPDFYDPGPEPTYDFGGTWIAAMSAPVGGYTYFAVDLKAAVGELYGEITALDADPAPPGNLDRVGAPAPGYGGYEYDFMWLEAFGIDVPAEAIGPSGPGFGATVGELYIEAGVLTDDVLCGRAYGTVTSPVTIGLDQPVGLVRVGALDQWDQMFANCL